MIINDIAYMHSESYSHLTERHDYIYSLTMSTNIYVRV